MKPYISHEIFLWFGLLLFGMSGFFFPLLVESPNGFYAFVLVAALGGFGVSTYIWYTKSRGKHLVCPSGGDCNAVVESKYSRFFTIKLEYLGMLYFTVIFLSYLSMLLAPQHFNGAFRAFVMLLTASAFLFSAYLLSVQAFLLKKWCIWCILASLFSLTIFFIALISAAAVLSALARAESLLYFFKFLGFALGMGGATAMLFLFMRFLRDLNINEKELVAIKDVSELVWVGLGLSVMSQFALFVANPLAFGGSSLFIAEMIALFGAVFAGAVFMIIYAPFLALVPFTKNPNTERREGLAALRRPALITGSVALASWYFAFATNFIPAYGIGSLLLAYGGMLAAACAGGWMWELQYGRKSANT